MNVTELQDRILELSHDEATPDTDLRNKALVWLNHAYRELMDELQPYLQDELMQVQTVQTDDDGTVTLAFDVQRMVRVVDATNGRALAQVSLADMVDENPLLNEAGAPKKYWVQGDVLTVYPKQAVRLTVRYLPALPELLEADAETAILLPRMYHYALVWGGLVWASMYERAFSAKSDIVLFQQKWDEARRRVKLSLAAKPDKVLRTTPAE